MFKIALRNIFRNKRRSALTGLSIAAAVMIAIYIWSFVSGIVDNGIDNHIRLNSGHIRILNSDYLKRERMLPLEANIPDYADVEMSLKDDPRVMFTAPRIKFGVLLEHEGHNKPVVGIGVVPEAESRISRLDQNIREGRMIRQGQEEMNIGAKLARDMGLKLGDTLTVVTQTAYGSITAMNLKVVGIFGFDVPSVDGTTFYIPLDKAGEMLDLEGRATEIFVLIKDPESAPKAAREIKAGLDPIYHGKYEAVPWQDQGIFYFWASLAKRIYGTLYFLVLFLASFTILNTMFMSVLERTKEIGMMKSLGLKDREVVYVILTEACLIGLFAGLVGAAMGAAIAYYLTVHGIDLTGVFEAMKGNFNFPVSYVYRAAFKWSIIFFGFCMGFLFSILAAIPPAMRAAKMQPTEALREI